MLRNLNRTLSRGRICGTNKSGVLGALIPSTGTSGPAYLYPSLNLPDDSDNEYQGYITSLPAGVTFFANEDTSFTASANDGVYAIPWDLYENGVYLGSTSLTLQIGSSSASISCRIGDAFANGSNSAILQSSVIQCDVGSSSANGLNSSILIATQVQAFTGICASDGSFATITFGNNNIKSGDRLSFQLISQSFTITLL